MNSFTLASLGNCPIVTVCTVKTAGMQIYAAYDGDCTRHARPRGRCSEVPLEHRLYVASAGHLQLRLHGFRIVDEATQCISCHA
jgi:hypothetical protein